MSGSRSTEDSILNSIPDFAGETGGEAAGGTDKTTQDSGTSAQPSTSAQPTQTGSEGSGTQPATQQPTQQAFRRRHDNLIEQPNADNPKVRDLVDPVTGKVVAKGGIERHVYDEGQRHARENVKLTQQVTQLQGFVNSVTEVTREAARLNISPQDQMAALRVMSDFLKDPVKTLEYLVSEVKSKGYPIPFLEQGINPGMDMTAIARMIDTKMAPFTQQHQQTIQQQQVRQRAEQELNTFLEENQDANSNLDVLGEMLQAQPQLTIQSAFTKMIRWAHEQGLDWTQPLKPQIAALQQGTQGQQPTHQQPTQQTTARPMPGRGVAPTQATPLNGQAGEQFNENASWADIIGSAMRDHGVRLN